MSKLQRFENVILNCKIGCYNDKNNIYFRGKDVANALGYENTTQAIITNVDDDDRYKLEELSNLPIDCLTFNERKTIYINESGLYSLILRSNKEEARQFKSWITSEVIPSIRKTGQYSTILPTHNQISIFNEKDLHYNIIKFIRHNFYEPVIIAPLGENQITSEMRIDSYNKGYQSGAPDILLLNYHKYFNGLAIELKTPKGNGIVSENQQLFLNKLSNNKYKVIVSNDFTDIIIQLLKYKEHLMYNCKYCIKCFYSSESRNKHYKYFHKNHQIYEP